MRSAASRIVSSGEHTISGARISSDTGRAEGSGASRSCSAASSSERVTYRSPAGRASSGRATDSWIR